MPQGCRLFFLSSKVPALRITELVSSRLPSQGGFACQAGSGYKRLTGDWTKVKCLLCLLPAIIHFAALPTQWAGPLRSALEETQAQGSCMAHPKSLPGKWLIWSWIPDATESAPVPPLQHLPIGRGHGFRLLALPRAARRSLRSLLVCREADRVHFVPDGHRQRFTRGKPLLAHITGPLCSFCCR